MTTTLLAVAGTRPELLKLAPVIRQILQRKGPLSIRTCFSGQHLEIFNSVLGDVGVKPDVDLRAELTSRTLSQNLAWLLTQMDKVLHELRPEGVLVQGDTNTVLAAALAAFHHQIPSFHIEAGLRTSSRLSPFPEEGNRRLVSKLASLHFAPTELGKANLIKEAAPPGRVLVTGNTVIDSLLLYAGQHSPQAEAILARTRNGTRKILVTLHRRENAALVSAATNAVKRLIQKFDDVEVLWVLHMNGIRSTVQEQLSGLPNIHLLEPQSYQAFVHLMKAATLIMSDSGGIQEEAPTLGKPVLVLRDQTERPEALQAGSSLIVGCSQASIFSTAQRLLENDDELAALSVPRHLFGDGHASERIVDALEDFYRVEHESPFMHSWPPDRREQHTARVPLAAMVEMLTDPD